MHINDNRTRTEQGDARQFTGEVWMDELAAPGEHTQLSMLRVHFAPGARTGWHKHPRGQISVQGADADGSVVHWWPPADDEASA